MVHNAKPSTQVSNDLRKTTQTQNIHSLAPHCRPQPAMFFNLLGDLALHSPNNHRFTKPPIRCATNLMPPCLRLPLFHCLLTTTAVATTTSLMPSPTSPKPINLTLLLRLCTVVYQHQNSPDGALNCRLSALPLPLQEI
jgi:hypothetical protein